jgi:hypothetical protein
VILCCHPKAGISCMKVYFFQKVSNFSKTFSKQMALNFTLQVNIPLLVHKATYIMLFVKMFFQGFLSSIDILAF